MTDLASGAIGGRGATYDAGHDAREDARGDAPFAAACAAVSRRVRDAEERAGELARAHQALTRSVRQIAEEGRIAGAPAQILREIARAAGAEVCWWFAYDAAAHTLEAVLRVRDGALVDGPEPDEPAIFRAPFAADVTPAFAALAASGDFLVAATDAEVPAAWPGALAWHRREGRPEALAYVVRAGDTPLGVLGMGFRRAGHLTPARAELVRALAGQLALAVELARLSRAESERALLLERERVAAERAGELARANAALRAAATRLAVGGDLAHFLEYALRDTAEQLEASSACLFLLDAAGRHFVLTAAVMDGAVADVAHDARLATWRTPLAVDRTDGNDGWERLLGARGYGVHDIAAPGPDTWSEAVAFHRALGHALAVSVPLVVAGRPVGFTAFGLRAAVLPEQHRLLLARALADQAALALHVTRLADEAGAAALARERQAAAEERAAALAAEVARRAHAERVAAGQAAVLTRAVERLANAGPDPTAVPSTVAGVRDALLAALAEQLGGARVDLWMLDRARDEARLVITCHADGRLVAGADQPEHPGARPVALSAMEGSPGYHAFETGECLRIGPEYDHPTHAPFRAWMDAQGLVSTLQTPVRIRGEARAVFFVLCAEDRPFPPAERELATAVAHLLALAFEAERLADAVRASAEQSAVLQERARLARELHDTLAQGLAGIVMQLGAVREKLADDRCAARGASGVRAPGGPLDRAERLARENLAAARRAITMLRPEVLGEEGLGATLARLVDEARRDWGGAVGARGARAGPVIVHEVRGVAHLAPPEVEFELVRIAQAALANAARHARATRIVVALDHGAGPADGIRLTVGDDGCGFDPSQPRPGHFGLVGMRERAARIGAALTLVTAPGEGTEVVVMWAGDGAGERGA